MQEVEITEYLFNKMGPACPQRPDETSSSLLLSFPPMGELLITNRDYR